MVAAAGVLVVHGTERLSAQIYLTLQGPWISQAWGVMGEPTTKKTPTKSFKKDSPLADLPSAVEQKLFSSFFSYQI